MSNEMTTSGGSLHPGRPVIWPTGKKTPTPITPQPSQVKEAISSKEAQQAAQTAKEAAQAQVQAKQQVTKEVTVKDLKELLVKQQVEANDFNVKLATLMLRYGMEVSKETFAKVINMLSGTDKSVSSQEAAILLLMKGIESPEAAKTLATFLRENPQLANQMLNLSANMADLKEALNMSRGVLPNEILEALSALLAQFDENITGLPKKFRFSGDNTTGRRELINDMRALKALLTSVQESASLPDTAEGQIVQSNMMSVMESLDKAIANVLSQSFLSKQTGNTEVNYSYYQIPNSMAKTPQTIEIVIKRDEKSGGKSIDPKDTQIFMSLDTENLGKIAISMIIKNKQVEFIFNTQRNDAKELIAKGSKDLASALSEQDFEATKVQVNVNPSMCAIKPFLIPFLGVEGLMCVDTSI